MSHDPDLTRVRHMIEAIREILDFVKGRDLKSILTDRPLQHLIIRNLEILGEAASRTSRVYRKNHPDVPWRDVIELRNRLIHVYFDLNLDIIWRTVQQDLPALLPMLEAILEPKKEE